MTLNATPSMDGQKRANIRVDYRMGAHDFSNILCLKHREDEEAGVEALPDYSRTAILDIVRNQLKQNADAPNWWMDEVEDPWIDEVRQWADDLVRRRFFEFF